MMTETTKVGVVNNALAYLNGATSKAEFVYGVVLGLGSNFSQALRKEFTAMVMANSAEKGPDPDPLLNYFDKKS